MEKIQLLSNDSITALKEEVRRNHRLRFGLWAILFILIFYGINMLIGLEQTERQDYLTNIHHYQQLSETARQNEWASNAKIAKQLATQLSNRLWTADSRGMAQAKIQIWVDNLLGKLHMESARTQVEEANNINGYDGIWQVSVRIQGLFTPRKFSDFLLAIENHTKIIVVETMKLMAKPRSSFNITLRFYFKAKGTKEANGAIL